MKNKIFSLIVLIISIFIVSSCYTSEDQKRLYKECTELENKKISLQKDVNTLKEKTQELNTNINELNIEKNSLYSGKEIKYIVKFQIKQGTFTLDIFEHIKNEMNSIEIELPVSKDFYNKLSIGQDITDAFKYGSLIFNGDFSTLHMRVINKRIE